MRHHSANFGMVLLHTVVYVSVGALVTTPVSPSAHQLTVRVSAHTGNRVCPDVGIKEQAPGEYVQRE
jgi:hypothetical protein